MKFKKKKKNFDYSSLFLKEDKGQAGAEFFSKNSSKRIPLFHNDIGLLPEDKGQAGETFAPLGESFIKKLLGDNSGQAGAVFRLMIDAIVGIAILAVILGIITHFNHLQVRASLEEFNTKVLAASHSPDGSVISSSNDLAFVKGTAFSSNQMQELTGYPASCFSFNSNRAFVDVRGGGSVAEVLQNTNTKLYVKCSPTNESADDVDDTTTCEIECVISFGEKLDSDLIRSEE